MRTPIRSAAAYQGNGLTIPGPLRNPCPLCGAKPGYRCTRINGGIDSPFKDEPIGRPHASRATPRRKRS